MPATEGPWKFDRKSGFVEVGGDKPLEDIVCFIRGNPHDEQACARGALIAAAPDMAKLLDLAQRIMRVDRLMLHELSAFPGFSAAGKVRDDLDKTLAAIDGVLAQAKGETPP